VSSYFQDTFTLAFREMPNSAVSGRISDLHKSAFWIYGVTAMVMREPFASVIRHASTAGLGDWQVRLELLRVAVVLMLMARVFLASGLYFDQVYLREDSAARFPRRSYPVDFLAGLLQFLTIVAGSTAVALHLRSPLGLSIFAILVVAFLLFDAVWIALSRLLGYSTVREIGSRAMFGTAALIVVVGIGVRIAGGDPVLAEQAAFIVLFGATLFEMSKLVEQYGR
jgi:hypothetical protein